MNRSNSGQVTIQPERDSRILIDGKKCETTTNLTQGTMLTIGKSNYLRFNNPAEAQLLKSTIGSNDRISMPQIDFNQESSSSSSSPGGCSKPEGPTDDILKNLHDILNSQNYNNHRNAEAAILEKMTKNDLTNNINNFHSPKVFTADSITVNTPAKDVLGSKFNNFTKNLSQIFTKNDNTKNPLPPSATQRNNNHVVSTVSSSSSVSSQMTSDQFGVLTKVNNVSSHPAGPLPTSASPKVQQFSPCYDRYPKPGSYGSLQVFPMNGVNSEINNTVNPENHGSPPNGGAGGGLTELHRQRAQIERMQEQEISKMEHDRLDEILKMCADFERQNQNVQSSPIVQNRIKTNGSLPREKKTFANTSDSEQNLFFPQTPTHSTAPSTSNDQSNGKPHSGYENVQILPGRRVDIATGNATLSPIPNRYPRADTVSPSNSINGYENVGPPKKSYIPQSPRTKIKTCVSPKKEATVKKSEYDMLVQSFEDKLRLEIQLLRENKNFDTLKQQGEKLAPQEQIYGTLEKRNKNINNLTLNIRTDGRSSLEQMKTERKKILTAVRDLKTQISDLQRQEEEVLREVNS